MSRWRIQGGNRLEGSRTVQGAKAAALPILAASMLTGCETELLNCPVLPEVENALTLLRRLGCPVLRREDTVSVDSRCASGGDVTDLRFLGAALGRFGETVLTGGEWDISAEITLEALGALGAEWTRCENGILCRAPKLNGGHVRLSIPDAVATGTVMTAACAAQGETVITNAAQEPEVEDLARFLRTLGADIDGAGSPVVVVRGFRPRRRAGHRLLPDRHYAAAVLCACACAGGDVELRGLDARVLRPVLDVLAAMGCFVYGNRHRVRLRREGRLTGGGVILSRACPGLSREELPLLTAVSLQADGLTVLSDEAWEERNLLAAELIRLGGDVRSEGRVTVVSGVQTLRGDSLYAHSARNGAALMAASLAARGTSVLDDGGRMAHEYEKLDAALRELGADVLETEN